MPKRVLTGTIVSDKTDKTVVVKVERRVKHPLYGKIIKLSKKYHAHDAGNAFKSGEQVRIEECAPLSKLKTWTVLDRIGAAKAAVIEISETAEAEPPKPVRHQVADRAAKPAPSAEAEPAEAPKPEAKPAAEAEPVEPPKPAAEAEPAKPVKPVKDKAAKPAKPAAKPAAKAKKAKADDAAEPDA
jgi:small subunit ribosomal protein S17